MAESRDDIPMLELYESFYRAVENSAAYARYCREVFGADFSQDGFSDLGEIAKIMQTAGIKAQSDVLDMGCGNGKLLEYIHDKTGARAWGFDYSKNAIEAARARTAGRPLIFGVGLIGEKQYEDGQFDAVLSIDTMYFAEKPETVVSDVMRWLRPGGAFIALYGAADFIEGSIARDETALARAIRAAGYGYEAENVTRSHYRLMRRKRAAALKLERDFRAEKLDRFHERIMTESIDLDMPFEEFERHFGRFMYVVRK
jgi:2-polyprenyl-3-methyl-5-hydroxy-6-metoxy-1,4-benzoquinol methylase